MTDIKLVRDLMKVGVKTCPMSTPIIEIARLLLDADLEAVVVLDEEGHAVGIVSQDELVRAYGRDDIQELTAESIMREQVPQIPPDIPVTAAAQIMHDLRVRVVFLMHNADGISYPAASLSYKHLLRALCDADLKDLGIKAARQSPIETFIQRRDAARRRAQSHDEES
jgi:CBS domain-containing protein